MNHFDAIYLFSEINIQNSVDFLKICLKNIWSVNLECCLKNIFTFQRHIHKGGKVAS